VIEPVQHGDIPHEGDPRDEHDGEVGARGKSQLDLGFVASLTGGCIFFAAVDRKF
jgi:hypothetical protein